MIDNILKIIFLIFSLLILITKVEASTTAYFVSKSPLRSTTALIDSFQNIVNTYKYNAFGHVSSSTQSIVNSYQYDGEQQESETGLTFLRNRYYDSQLGRFITKDNFRGETENSQTLNPYPYCANNPVAYVDSDGNLWRSMVAGGTSGLYIGFLTGLHRNDVLAGIGGGLVGGVVGAFTGFKLPDTKVGQAAAGAVAGLAGNITANAISRYGEGNQNVRLFDNTTAALLSGAVLGIAGRTTSKAIASVGATEWGVLTGTQVMMAPLAIGLDVIDHQLDPSGTALDDFITPGFKHLLWDAAFGGPAYANEIPSFGGVSLSKTAQLMLNVQDVEGATFDPATGQVILYGKQNTALPNMKLDDLSVAVRSVYGLNKPAQDPGVSIGTEPSDIPGQMKVRYDGDTINTKFGSVMFDADRLLKTLTLGKDNITGNAVGSTVVGYKNMVDRYRDVGNGSYPFTNIFDRMWFRPKQITLAQNADGSAMEFETTTMELLTESKFENNVSGNPVAEAFAAHFTQNYDAFSNESPILKELKRLGKITAVVKWIKDNDIPFDLSFFSSYTPEFVSTPSYTPATSVQRVWFSGNSINTFTMTGGVAYALDASNFVTTINANAATAGDLAVSTRPTEGSFSWNFTAPGANGQMQQYTAIAQSFTRSQKDGSVRGSKADLSCSVTGDLPLTFVRYYNSFSEKDYGFGVGWQITPYEIRFPETPKYFTFGGSAITVSAYFQIYLRQGEGEYLYILSGLDTSNKPVYKREGGQDLLKDLKDGTFVLDKIGQGKVVLNAQGQLTRLTDRNGLSINYNYTSSRLSSISHQNGRTLTINYTGNVISSVVGPGSKTVNYTSYPNGQLNTVVDPANHITTYFYDTDKHINKITDPKSNTAYQAVYDDYNRASSQILGGAPFSSSFNLSDRMTVSTDPKNATSTQIFDADYKLSQNQDYLNNQVSITYDPNGFGISKITDADGKVSEYKYDTSGNLWYVKGADGSQQFFFHDAHNNLVAKRDELGFDTVYVFPPTLISYFFPN